MLKSWTSKSSMSSLRSTGWRAQTGWSRSTATSRPCWARSRRCGAQRLVWPQHAFSPLDVISADEPCMAVGRVGRKPAS
eukprot:scaffold41531_cov21-Tisochrysis_lutea.AAC.1